MEQSSELLKCCCTHSAQPRPTHLPTHPQMAADPPTTKQQVLLSFSGGKDSSLALHHLLQDPQYQVVGLLVSVRQDGNCISVHEVRRSLLDRQLASLAADLAVFEASLPPQCSNAVYEASFFGALDAARRQFPQLSVLAFGDLFLEDVRDYRVKMLECWPGHTGGGRPLQPLFPLWGQDTTALAQHFLDVGFQAHLVCVDTTQLDASFAGRAFDAVLLRDLPAGVDWCGEKGEFHTFVRDGPIFQRPVEVRVGAVELRGGGDGQRFAFCDLLPAWQETDKDA